MFSGRPPLTGRTLGQIRLVRTRETTIPNQKGRSRVLCAGQRSCEASGHVQRALGRPAEADLYDPAVHASMSRPFGKSSVSLPLVDARGFRSRLTDALALATS
jgi:hypothetical protein